MIPKIIHYSWFSGEQFPPEIEKFISSWKQHLSDYEFILWDARKLAECNNNFANEAISVKKWAFAADFIRLYAVYKYGGIWLDTDVEVFKSFNPFLKYRMFIGREYYTHNYNPQVCYLTSHCFGAEKEHPFIKECLDFYNDRKFIRTSNLLYPNNLRFDMTTIPELQATLALRYGYNWNKENNKYQILSEDIHVFPHQFFDAPGYHNMSEVICIHRVFGSWKSSKRDRANYSFTNPQRKGVKYYSEKLINKILSKIKLQLIKLN